MGKKCEVQGNLKIQVKLYLKVRATRAEDVCGKITVKF